jgi:Tfp pilus assembly protein PilO
MALSDFHFGGMPRSMQTLIFAFLAGCAAYVVYTHRLKDLLSELELIQAEIGKLELSVSRETDMENQLGFSKMELVHLNKRFEALKSSLSLQKEMPGVLKGIQQMAASSKLTISRLKSEPLIRRSFCSDWPIRIEATGNCDGLGFFFEKISQATRTFNVEAISIKASDNPTGTDQTLIADFTVTVFVFSEESPETLEDNKEPKNAPAEIGGSIQR